MGRHGTSLTELGQRLAGAQDEALAQCDLDAAKRRLLAALEPGAVATAVAPAVAEGRAPSRWRRLPVALGIAGALAAAAAALLFFRPAGTIEPRVDPLAAAPPTSARPPPVQADRDPPPPWRVLAREGDSRGALGEAERVGFAAVCEQSSPGELISLAAAARNAKSPSRASEALRVLRRRFPASPEAVEAAFGLGNIALEALSCREAADWFATVLREDADGPFGMEATSRAIEAYLHLGERAAAREQAERYLARWPSGPQVALAKRALAE